MSETNTGADKRNSKEFPENLAGTTKTSGAEDAIKTLGKVSRDASDGVIGELAKSPSPRFFLAALLTTYCVVAYSKGNGGVGFFDFVYLIAFIGTAVFAIHKKLPQLLIGDEQKK